MTHDEDGWIQGPDPRTQYHHNAAFTVVTSYRFTNHISTSLVVLVARAASQDGHTMHHTVRAASSRLHHRQQPQIL